MQIHATSQMSILTRMKSVERSTRYIDLFPYKNSFLQSLERLNTFLINDFLEFSEKTFFLSMNRQLTAMNLDR